MIVPAQVQAMIARGALIVCNHSAGKDSQAMYLLLRDIVPHHQLLVVHAELPEVEWPGTVEHIRATIGGHRLILTRASKTLLGMAEARGMFPSPKYRQCTSDLKRGPIERVIRRYLADHPEHGGLIVNAMGMRAQESSARAAKATLKTNERASVAGRHWVEWLPIHDLTEAQVFATIAAAGQEPHWAYKAGMTRLSCCFCIMASTADLKTAAKLQPDLYRKYVNLERKLGRSMLMPKAGASAYLEDVTGIPIPKEIA